MFHKVKCCNFFALHTSVRGRSKSVGRGRFLATDRPVGFERPTVKTTVIPFLPDSNKSHPKLREKPLRATALINVLLNGIWILNFDKNRKFLLGICNWQDHLLIKINLI